VGDEEELSLLQEQLNGLAKAVEGDTNLPTNIADYLVTLNSLKKRMATANKVQEPDELYAGTKTGRVSSKNPVHSVAKPSYTVGPDGPTGPDLSEPPPTNRRAAIAHTRKLNESGSDI